MTGKKSDEIYNKNFSVTFVICLFSSPEATIHSVSTKNNDLWLVPKYAQSLWGSILVTVDSYSLFQSLEIGQTSKKSVIRTLPGSETARGRYSWCCITDRIKASVISCKRDAKYLN